jgi:hypothetical protein
MGVRETGPAWGELCDMHMTSTRVTRDRIIQKRSSPAVIQRRVKAVKMNMRLRDRGGELCLLSQFREIESP